MLGRVLLTAVAISYLICVLVLNGVQKEDLDVGLVQRLQQRNINIDELSNEKLRQECITKTKLDLKEPTEPDEGKATESIKSSVQSILSNNEKDKVEENFSETLDPSQLDVVLQLFNDKNVKPQNKLTSNLGEKFSNTKEDVPEIANGYVKEPTHRSGASSQLESLLHYFDDKNVKSQRKLMNNVEEKDNETKEKEPLKEVVAKIANSFINKPIQAADRIHKNPEVYSTLQYLRDLSKSSEVQDNKNGNNEIAESKTLSNMKTSENNAFSKKNINSYDILRLSKILSDNISRKQSVQESSKSNKNLDSDTVFQALNQILRKHQTIDQVKEVTDREESKLKVQTTTSFAEHLPYIYSGREIIKEARVDNEKQRDSINLDVSFTPKIIKNKNYAHLTTKTENMFDPGLPKQKYNYYLQIGPDQQTTTTTQEPVTTQTSTTVDHQPSIKVDSVDEKAQKEIKLSQEIIKQIAESVKDIVLKDLRKQFSSIVPTVPTTTTALTTTTPTTTTTTPTTTTTTPTTTPTTTTSTTTVTTTTAKVPDKVTTASSITTNGDRTFKNESSSTTPVNASDVQQSSSVALEMVKILAIMNQIKAQEAQRKNLQVTTVKSQSVTRTRKHSEMTSSRVRTRQYDLVRIQHNQFSPLLVDASNHPELMPPPIIQGQHPNYEKSIVPLQERTPGELRMAPLLIQSNSDQVPPLSIPLMRPSLMNLNIILTTQSPYPRPHLSQDKWNREKLYIKPQSNKNIRKEKSTSTTNIPKIPINCINQRDTEKSTDCTKIEKEHVLLNKTDEIMTRLKNIETLFANLKEKNTSIQADHTDKPREFLDLTYFRERQDTIRNLTNITQQNDDISKKIRDLETSLARLRDINSNKSEKQNVTPSFEKPPINNSTDFVELVEQTPKYEDIIAKLKSKKLGKMRLENPEAKIRNTEKFSVYTKKREEIDDRLKNIEREIKNLQQKIRAGPIMIDHQLYKAGRGRGRGDRLKKLETKTLYNMQRYPLQQYSERHDRARPSLSQKYKKLVSGPYKNKSKKDMKNFKNVEIQLMTSKYGDPIAEPLETPHYASKNINEGNSDNVPKERNSYEAKQGLSFNTRAKENSDRAANTDEGFNPYKQFINFRTTKRRKTRPRDSDNYPVTRDRIRGFHEKLETAQEIPMLKPPGHSRSEDNLEVTPVSRHLLPIQNKRQKYDDTNFKNFMKTQEQVNDMLEKILASKNEPEFDPAEVMVS